MIDKMTAEEFKDANCLNFPDVNFFPTTGEDVNPARAVCRLCIVREACFDETLYFNGNAGGIRAGFSGKQWTSIFRESLGYVEAVNKFG